MPWSWLCHVASWKKFEDRSGPERGMENHSIWPRTTEGRSLLSQPYSTKRGAIAERGSPRITGGGSRWMCAGRENRLSVDYHFSITFLPLYATFCHFSWSCS